MIDVNAPDFKKKITIFSNFFNKNEFFRCLPYLVIFSSILNFWKYIQDRKGKLIAHDFSADRVSSDRSFRGVLKPFYCIENSILGKNEKNILKKFCNFLYSNLFRLSSFFFLRLENSWATRLCIVFFFFDCTLIVVF